MGDERAERDNFHLELLCPQVKGVLGAKLDCFLPISFSFAFNIWIVPSSR